MTIKTDFTFKNVNISKDEFIMHYSMLLRNAIQYSKLCYTILYDKYHNLILHMAPFGVEMENDEVREKVEQYEKEMRYYKEQIKELERLHSLLAKTSSLNKKFEIMKEFNELMMVNFI